MYLPCAQLGVQSLTFRTPLPKATECQLVHVRPLTSSLEGMQPMSYPAGRTWPWPLQLTSTTWLDPADAGPAASTTPPAVPAMATRAPASATRARMSLIELPAFRSWVPITLSELSPHHSSGAGCPPFDTTPEPRRRLVAAATPGRGLACLADRSWERLGPGPAIG